MSRALHYALYGRVSTRRDQCKTILKQCKTNMKNHIRSCHKSKRHIFQVQSCDIRSSAPGWTKKVQYWPRLAWRWQYANIWTISKSKMLLCSPHPGLLKFFVKFPDLKENFSWFSPNFPDVGNHEYSLTMSTPYDHQSVAVPPVSGCTMSLHINHLPWVPHMTTSQRLYHVPSCWPLLVPCTQLYHRRRRPSSLQILTLYSNQSLSVWHVLLHPAVCWKYIMHKISGK